MSNAKFSLEDARAIIALAQNAPLQNMKMAAEVSSLLQRFSTFVDFHLSNPAARNGSARVEGSEDCEGEAPSA